MDFQNILKTNLFICVVQLLVMDFQNFLKANLFICVVQLEGLVHGEENYSFDLGKGG